MTTVDIITVMDDSLSNKIAAGEVVERPASIVKELVENAIDAGATIVEISLEEAGLTSIRVTDNGKGMSHRDALQAFERHATSKIKNEHDLFRIRTLGFRGEALASIASVSKIQLWTSDGETTGTEVELDGGTIIRHDYAALRKGTDITVSQLFFNTPARLKHMKTIQTELGHTIDLVNRLALSHPLISFKLYHHSQQLLYTIGNGDQRRVIAAIYGVATAQKMIPFTTENADYKVTGLLSLPELTRASRNYMTLIVNGRWVKSHAVNHTILDAYHTYLPIGRYPITVINVEGDPLLLDVNVHPSKQQIRMSKEGELLNLLKEAVRSTIQQQVIVPDAIKKQPIMKPTTVQPTIWDAMPIVREQNSSLKKATEQMVEGMAVNEILPDPTFIPETEQVNNETEEKEWSEEEEIPTVSSKREHRFPSLVPVGQVHGTYIIAQNEDGFYMIDQHAAQERIKYEYFRDRLQAADHGERQMLLLPLIFHYSMDEKVRIEENIQHLHDVGIYLEPFGPTSYTVKEYPAWFPNGEETSIIEHMIEQVLQTKKVDVGKLREESAILMSCKKSIKANHYLSIQDMEKLLEDLSKAENPFTCPHGRPVLIHFSTYEIEKMFKRVM